MVSCIPRIRGMQAVNKPMLRTCEEHMNVVETKGAEQLNARRVVENIVVLPLIDKMTVEMKEVAALGAEELTNGVVVWDPRQKIVVVDVIVVLIVMGNTLLVVADAPVLKIMGISNNLTGINNT